jgi:hypothetical protein
LPGVISGEVCVRRHLMHDIRPVPRNCPHLWCSLPLQFELCQIGSQPLFGFTSVRLHQSCLHAL